MKTFKKLCILGMGYIGLPMASTFASHGLDVTGVDVSDYVLNRLQNGEVHIKEPGLKALFDKAFQSGKLHIQSQPVEADAFIIAVPTPFRKENKQADMRYVESAAEAIVPYLRKGNLVMLESTSPPRSTIDLLAPILEKSGLKTGEDYYLAYTPERVYPGNIIDDLINGARVIGGYDEESTLLGKELYEIFVAGQIILTDSTTAEMVKLMENTYRDINIAIANEFSRLADRFEIDVWEAIEIANLHPRVQILRPGPGVGGHCISVDPWFLVEKAPDISPLVHTARNVNDSQPDFVLQTVNKIFPDGVANKSIGVLGLAFKPDVDDFRESPAVIVAQKLIEAGAAVTGYDPYLNDNFQPGFEVSTSLEDIIQGKDLLIVLVAHRQLAELSVEAVLKLTETRKIFDTVNVLDRDNWKKAGFELYSLGVNK